MIVKRYGTWEKGYFTPTYMLGIVLEHMKTYGDGRHVPTEDEIVSMTYKFKPGTQLAEGLDFPPFSSILIEYIDTSDETP